MDRISKFTPTIDQQPLKFDTEFNSTQPRHSMLTIRGETAILKLYSKDRQSIYASASIAVDSVSTGISSVGILGGYSSSSSIFKSMPFPQSRGFHGLFSIISFNVGSNFSCAVFSASCPSIHFGIGNLILSAVIASGFE